MKPKRFIRQILSTVLLIAICIVAAADAQVLFTSRRAWVIATDCSAIITNGHGCYDSDDNTWCIGNGSSCTASNPPVGANFSTQATPGTEAVTWSAAGWNEDGVTWTFAGGVLTHVTGNTTAVTSTLAVAPVAGTTYKVTITGTGGGATATYTLGGVTGTTIAASGAIAITDYITASTTGQLIITPANTCTVAITNISVKPLTNATGDLTVEGNIYAKSQILVDESSTYPQFASRIYPTYGFGIVSGAPRVVINGTITHGFDSTAYLNYSDTSRITLGASSDLIFGRDAANAFALRNVATQQIMRVYNTADAFGTLTNYERLSITGTQGNSGNMTMETAGTGGDNLNLVLTAAGTGSVKLRGPSWSRTTTKTVSTTPVTLTSEEVCNANIFVTTGASVINYPTGAATLDGCVARFTAIAAVTFQLQPAGSEVMVLNGTALTGGNGVGTDGAVDAAFSVVYDATATRLRVIGVNGVISDIGA